MAVDTNNANNELVKYAREVWARGYVRENQFDRFMSRKATSIIRLVLDIEAEGREINIPLVDALRASGVGTGLLSGNEEAIDDYGYRMWADWLRHAVKYSKATAKDSSIRIKNEATPLLNQWIKKNFKEEFIRCMLSIPQATAPTGFRGATGARINGVVWSSATATQKNNWMDANSDRVLFGSAIGNYVAGNFATSAANIDTTNDRLSSAMVSLAKRRAQSTTQNKMTPYMIDGRDEEMWVMFVGSRAMRDLKNESVIRTAIQEAFSTKMWESQNPLFKAGDVYWDNVLVTEIKDLDDILTQSGIGNAASDVVPCFLCGQSAFGHVVGQMPIPTKNDVTDYDFNTGIGIEGQYGVGKIAKIPDGGSSLVDWGVCTVFVSSVADA